MVIVSVVVFFMFLSGFGLSGGFSEMIDRLGDADPDLLTVMHPQNSLFNSPWSLFCIVIAHIPLGMLPHIGNKLWALNDGTQRHRFLGLAFALGMLLPLVSAGGLLARAVLGDALLAPGSSPNEAIPALFIELMPAWLAALLGVTILSAIMSTADGLVVSTSQVFANDIYRKTLVPRWYPGAGTDEIDRKVLVLSRWSTVVVLLGAAALAWSLLDMNVALLVWAGIGGMISALAGPMVFGVLWRRATRAGALAGLIGGALVFLLTHTTVAAAMFTMVGLNVVADWLALQMPNPYACATLGSMSSVLLTVLVSLVTRPLPESHLRDLFDSELRDSVT